MTSLVKIGTTELTGLKGYKVQPNKLWVDADRNMAGNLMATYVGTFYKLVLEFTYQSQADRTTLLGLLASPSFSVTFYNPTTNSYLVGTFYAGDFEASLYSQETELFEPMTVSLIPFTKTFTPSV